MRGAISSTQLCLLRDRLARPALFLLALSLGITGQSRPALAQGFAGAAGDSARVDTGRFLPQQIGPPQSTILPTDVLPLPAVQNRMTVGENMQLRILQHLPARFYMTGTCETSFRYETNPFQFPTKRKLLTQLPPPSVIRTLSPVQQQSINKIIDFCGNDQMVFRVLPNVTGGFTVTPKTRVFANYFMIRDQLSGSNQLNTVIHSYSMGAQQDIRLGSRANLQVEFQARELNQIHQQAVFDFLPGLTASYVLTPRTVLFANALLQMRGKKYFQAPTKELDPFYTWGFLHQRGGWSFSSSSTLVQNFREPFRGNATIPVNNYAFILDFEVSRRLIRQLPGLQAFVRAEPIYNFKSHNRPGLAGMDFRLFFGLRGSVSKPSLTAGVEQLKRQIEEGDDDTPAPPGKGSGKPSAKRGPQMETPETCILPVCPPISGHEVAASSPQPIHGFIDDDERNETTAQALPATTGSSSTY